MSNQIEAARKALSREVGKTGRVWIRIFPDMPLTKKPAEVKLGKGKGDLFGYCAPVKPGRVLFEVDGVTDAVARESLRKAGTKLPLKTKVVAGAHPLTFMKNMNIKTNKGKSPKELYNSSRKETGFTNFPIFCCWK
jgi:ribosomal protein L16/L10AE